MPTTKDILSQVSSDPSKRFDPALISAYQKAGGALSNGAIPQQLGAPTVSYRSLTGQAPGQAQTTPVGIVSSRQGESAITKDITPVIEEARTAQQQSSEKKAVSQAPKPEPTIPTDITRDGETPEARDIRLAKEERAEAQRKQNEIYDQMVIANTAWANAQIASLRAQQEQARQAQDKANQTGIKVREQMGQRLGEARYAPEHHADVIADAIERGAAKLSEIDRKYTSAIGEIDAAVKAKNFEIAFAKAREVTAIKEEALKEIQVQQKALRDAQESADEATRLSNVDSVVSLALDSGISDPNDIFKAVKEAGFKMSAKELDASLKALSPNKTTSDLPADAKALEYYKKQGWLPEDATIFDYWKKEKESKSDKAQKVGMGAGGDFATFEKESIAMSVLPPTLRNSDAEKAYYLSGIKSGLAAGKTPYEIADTLMGYNISEKSAFSEGLRKYVSLIGGTDRNLAPELARLINSGSHDKAIALVENEIYKKIQDQEKDRFVSESDVIYVKDKVDEINKLLGEGWNNEVGAFTGTFGQFISRKFGYGNGVKIKAKVTSLTADLINKRAGSALTESEWERLVAGNVPAVNESAATWSTKLQELVDDPLSRLNAERTSFELPSINTNELKDRNLRIPAYSSAVAFDPLDVGGQNNQQSNPLSL